MIQHGVTFFILFLLVLVVIGLFFLVASAAMNPQDEQNSKLHKRCIQVGAIAVVAPVGFFILVMLSSGIGSIHDLHIEVKSDYIIPYNGYEVMEFMLGSKEYRIFSTERLDAGVRLGEPVASWKIIPGLYEFIVGAWSAGTYYRVFNDGGFDLLSAGRSRVFCAEKDFEAAETWYGDDTHYVWYLENDDEGEIYSIPLLSDKIFQTIQEADQTYDKDQEAILQVTVPKASDLDSYFDFYILYERSTDGVVTKECFVLLEYDGRLAIGNSSLLGETGECTYYLLMLPYTVEDLLMGNSDEECDAQWTTKFVNGTERIVDAWIVE